MFGITPTMVCGTSFRVMLFPNTDGSLPNRFRQKLSLINATFAVISSSGRKTRPKIGRTPITSKYPLVMPERGHSFRKLMESAAAMAGVQLHVEWEVSSVPAILDLVSAGIGHAALAEDAIRPFQHLKRLAVTPLVQPGIKISLCLVTPAQRRATPLRQRTAGLLAQLVRGV